MQNKKRRGPGPRDWLGIAAVVACGLAAGATSPFRTIHPRSYPAWKLSGATTRTVGQTHLAVWVSKSGKTGIGLTVRAERCGPTAPALVVKRVELHVDGVVESHPGGAAEQVSPPPPKRPTSGPAEPPPPTRTRSYVYVGIPFDNEALWNAGHNKGRLVLEIAVEGRPVTLTLTARQGRKGLHRSVPFGALLPCETVPSRCPDAGLPASQPASAPTSQPAPGDAGTVLEPTGGDA